MSTLLAALTALLRAGLPVRDGHFEVSLAGEPRDDPSGVFVSLRTLTTDDGGEPIDLKEQEVCFLPGPHVADEPRALAFARAWLSNVLTIARGYDDPTLLAPHDLVFAELLDDASLRDEGQLAAALADPARRAALLRVRDDASFRALLAQHLGAGDPRVEALVRLGRPSIELFVDDADPRSLPLGARTVELEARRRVMPGRWETPFYLLLAGERLESWDDDCAAHQQAAETFAFLDLEGDPRFLEPPRDRLLGYADPLQSDPYLACAHRAHAIPPEQRYTRAALERASEWMLRFQADSDPGVVSYGDAGTIQFFIRPEDLAARRFERVCCEFQSH